MMVTGDELRKRLYFMQAGGRTPTGFVMSRDQHNALMLEQSAHYTFAVTADQAKRLAPMEFMGLPVKIAEGGLAITYRGGQETL